MHITYRVTKDCFLLVQDFSFNRRVVLASPGSCLAHLVNESLDVGDTVIESWVSEDLFDTCTPFELVSELYSCRWTSLRSSHD